MAIPPVYPLGKMLLDAVIEDPAVIKTILTHLGLPTELPPVAPARSPPQLSFDDLDLSSESEDIDVPSDDEVDVVSW